MNELEVADELRERLEAIVREEGLPMSWRELAALLIEEALGLDPLVENLLDGLLR